MTNEESDLLNDFAQARIQSHFDRIFAAKPETERNRENMIHDRFHELCENLSEEDKKTARDYDALMFDRISDSEYLMYISGFRDGVRFCKLLHELEEEALRI